VRQREKRQEWGVWVSVFWNESIKKGVSHQGPKKIIKKYKN